MLFLLFLAVFLFQFLCWIVLLGPANRGGPELHLDPAPAANPPVSVIVCFRNEEKNLGKCIDGILRQQYPGEFELVLVDDNSTDNSASLVHPYTFRDPRVRLLDPGETRPGKKDALAHGIENARYDRLLLTDADCVPASSHWLWMMTEPLGRGKELVLGVSPVYPRSGFDFLREWQRFETFYVALKYFGFARRGYPYMGVGRNLAYTREFYRRAGGFTGHADLASGDDDLLVAGATEVKAERMPYAPAWAYTRAQVSWKDYFRQRRRHQSTGVRYPKGLAAFLTVLGISHGLFYLLGFFLLFTEEWFGALLVYVARILFVVPAYWRFYAEDKALRQQLSGPGAVPALGLRVAVFDACVGPMYLYLAVAGLVGSERWK